MICSNVVFLGESPYVVQDSIFRAAVFVSVVDMFLLNNSLRARILREGTIPTKYYETPGIQNGVVYELDPASDFPDLFRTLKRRGLPTEIGLDSVTQKERWDEMNLLFKLLKKAAIEANPAAMGKK